MIRERLNTLSAVKLALLLVIAVFAGSAVYTSLVIEQRQTALRNTDRYNIAFLASQGPAELARFLERVSSSTWSGSDVDADEIGLRFDILVNRLGLWRDGEFGAFADATPERRETLRLFEEAIAAGESLAASPGDIGARATLRRLFVPLEDRFARLAAEAHLVSAEQASRDKSELLGLHEIFTWLAIGLICCGIALLGLVLWHNRLLSKTHSRLHELTGDLRHASGQLNAAMDNMSQGLCMVDAEIRLTVFNRRFLSLFGLSRADAPPGAALPEVLARSPFLRADQVGLQNSALWPSLLCLENGVVLAATYRPLPDGGFVATYEDITDRRQAEAKIAHMAHHDALTELPNRALFLERLDAVLAGLEDSERSFAVLSLDLDRFKEVNDSLGHMVGDQLLCAVARRLLECIRPGGMVARFGGDEFLILQPSENQPRDSEAFARKIIEVVSAPYDIDGREILTAASIGVSVAPFDGVDSHQLLKNADLALYRAKGEGRGTYRFFAPEMDAALQARRSLGQDLRHALAHNELDIHYQPIINLRTNEIAGYEALLRWTHPQRGPVSPGIFIPLAEEIGVISELGKWVLRRACEEAARWPEHIRLALNLSPVQFRSRDLAPTVAAILAATELPPHRLELEITETVLLDENDSTLAILHQLRAMGTRIALDDFGTGFSSLSYLRAFPFDKIKIDRSFVRDSERPDCIAIIRSVASLAANLHMATTAEGIETAEQLDRVRKVGCTEGQGYFFARPKPAHELVHSPAGQKTEARRLRLVG